MNREADFLLNEQIRIDSHNDSNRFESRIGMLYHGLGESVVHDGGRTEMLYDGVIWCRRYGSLTTCIRASVTGHLTLQHTYPLKTTIADVRPVRCDVYSLTRRNVCLLRNVLHVENAAALN